MANFGMSVTDFVSLSQLAWNVYKGCKDAPESFQSISNEVVSLNVVLKEVDECLSTTSGLDAERLVDLNNISKNCRDVLKELQDLLNKYQSLGSASRRTWDRLRFGQENLDGLRFKLISVTSVLSAFNSSLTNSTQFVILRKLNQILTDVQRGKRESTIDTTKVHDNNSDEIWDGISKELEDEGVSRAALIENRDSIIQWIKNAIESGEWNELEVDPEDPSAPSTTAGLTPHLTPQRSLSPIVSGNSLAATNRSRRSSSIGKREQLPVPSVAQDSLPVSREVHLISATYGPLDVTDRMRRFFKATGNSRNGRNSFSFVPTNAFFAQDPLYGTLKVTVIVWQVMTRQPNGSRQFGEIRTTRAFEGSPMTITVSAEPSEPDLSRTSSPGSLDILSATYFNFDVTAHLRQSVSDSNSLKLKVCNEEFGHDPGYNWQKYLSVTYRHVDAKEKDDDTALYDVKTAVEGEDFVIHPRLFIRAANWGGLNVADHLQGQIDSDQILRIDMGHAVQGQDPWFGVLKTLSIVYQYEKGPMQLLITHDSAGTVSISPNNTPDDADDAPGMELFDLHFASDILPGIPFQERALQDFRLLAVIWGIKTCLKSTLLSISRSGVVVCTNKWFEFDGQPNWPKTCQMFVQDKSGSVFCVARREGETIDIVDHITSLSMGV